MTPIFRGIRIFCKQYFATTEIASEVHRINLNDGLEALKAKILHLVASSKVHGIMLQLPLTQNFYGLSCRDLHDYIPVEKDIDVLNSSSRAIMLHDEVNLKPATPQGICALLDFYHIPTKGRHIAIVGKGFLTGSPLCNILMQEPYNATLTICDEHTTDLKAITKHADIVITAAGVSNLITPDHVHAHSIIIDVAINKVYSGSKKHRIVGDVDPATYEKSELHTPVPGGVGLCVFCSSLG